MLLDYINSQMETVSIRCVYHVSWFRYYTYTIRTCTGRFSKMERAVIIINLGLAHLIAKMYINSISSMTCI